ncbi:major capsid family protein [Cupriavidus basilensis]
MVAYNKDRKYVQYPMTELQRTPLEYRSLFQITTYWSRLGQVEFRYGVTLAYRDGL